MNKVVNTLMVSILGVSLALPAFAARDPEAEMNHDFDMYYSDGIILPTADDTTMEYAGFNDVDHRDCSATPMKSFSGLPKVTVGDNDEFGHRMGDPMK